MGEIVVIFRALEILVRSFQLSVNHPISFFLELGYTKGKQRWENLQGALDVVKNAQKPANMQTSESTCKVGILGAKTVKNGKNGISRPSVGLFVQIRSTRVPKGLPQGLTVGVSRKRVLLKKGILKHFKSGEISHKSKVANYWGKNRKSGTVKPFYFV